MSNKDFLSKERQVLDPTMVCLVLFRHGYQSIILFPPHILDIFINSHHAWVDWGKVMLCNLSNAFPRNQIHFTFQFME